MAVCLAGILVAVGISLPWPQVLAGGSPPLLWGLWAGGLVAAQVFVISRGGDPLLLPAAAGLSAIGQVILGRLGPPVLVLRQSLWLLLGVGILWAILLVVRPVSRLDRWRYTLAALATGLVLLTFPLGSGSGARLWLDLGVFAIQPVEPLKLALALTLAGYLAERRELLYYARRRLGPLTVPATAYLVPLGIVTGLALLLLFAQRDLGSALLVLGVAVGSLYAAAPRPAHILLGLVPAALAAAGGYLFNPVVRERIHVWLDPWSDPEGRGFQVVQALIALAAGGAGGTGLGLGRPDLVPAVRTDFVFVALGEELGLLGVAGAAGLYLVLIGRCFRLSLVARSEYNRLLAVTLGLTLGVQSFIILAGTVRLMPLTGLTVPFISYGGSSLTVNYAILGLLAALSVEEETG